MAIISRAIEKPLATLYSYLQYYTGIQPRQRRRCLKSLSLKERGEISSSLVRRLSLRSIAGKFAWKRAKRPKPCLLTQNIRLKRLVAATLNANWPPEQISGWLKLVYPDDEGLRVSYETIYKRLIIQTRGLFCKELRNHLRTKRKFRHAKKHKPSTGQQIIAGVLIREKPAYAEDRAIPGH